MTIGIDIGGTKIFSVLFDGGKIIAASGAKTPKTKKEFVKTVKRLFEKLAWKGVRIKSIGIGAPGIVGKNKVIFCPNVSYLKNFDFRGVFPGFSAKIDNDARAFLRGELNFGAGAGAKKALAFTIGTGIGRAFAENGRVRKIKKFEYPEKWEKEYQRVRDGGNGGELAVFLAAKLSIIVKKYKPDAVIIGGGILKRKNFFGRLKKKVEEKNKKIKFKKAVLGDSAGALGAALLTRRFN